MPQVYQNYEFNFKRETTRLKKGQNLNIKYVQSIFELRQLYKSSVNLSTLINSYQFYKRACECLEEKNFKMWRSVRGDGNCYWRAVAFGYLEQIFVNEDDN